MSERSEVLADYTGQLLVENERLRKALTEIAIKGGITFREGGQVVEYDGRSCATIARQALGQEEEEGKAK